MNHGTWKNPIVPDFPYHTWMALSGSLRGLRYTAADGVQYRVMGKDAQSGWIYAVTDSDPCWVHKAQDWQTLKHHLDIGAPR